MSLKRVAIFGGTGMTGSCAVKSAVEEGYDLTMLVRDPAKVPVNIAGKVKLITGDVLDPASVSECIKGNDSVVVILGTRNDLTASTVMSEGLKNILNAMKENGVKIISVCLSAFLFYPEEKVPPMFSHVDKEHRRMLELLKESDTDWIAVFPPHIADEPCAAELIFTHDKHPGPRTVSKYDLGRFLVSCTNLPEHYKKIVGIAKKC